ncbi:MAG: glycine cleavage system protein GcvH [Erysipelotrichaceae bacterium]|nr:glycine cleavage system protein GcvH [Erysipelotrichaceae bacterium]MBQ4252748.1 glycine cleavage system protein GcvH [Erysipelotrichaceae bacterium]
MFKYPEDLKYTKSHEWVKEENGLYVVGLTDYAQDALGDIVFVNLPMVGDEVTADSVFADVESVKAVSDVYSPVSGTVVEVNEEMVDAPQLVNEDPYGAWFIKVENGVLSDELLTAEEYEEVVRQEQEG